MLSWITPGLCTITVLGTVPVSALQHRGHVLGSENFGPFVDAGSRPRDIGGSNITGVGGAFDYIVIGGGTAGNAVATRLSQGLPSASILIIEAGPYVTDNLDINVPGLRGDTLGTIYDWNFTTVPIEALDNRKIAINRGKVVGGCSAHNGLIWNRAAVAEFDAWEELGNPGWNWETMYAAMAKSENYTGPFSIDPTHYNASYSTNGYLPQAGPNLSILPDTTVAKINLQRAGINGTLHHATGVTLLDGTIITANKEVILSAGVVQSPQLLELSGIGQPDILRAANITPIIDLPGVGENYQDHLGLSVSYQLRDDVDYITTDLLTTNATYAAGELAKWFANETSQYDSVGGVGFGFGDWTSLVGAQEAARLQTLAVAATANASASASDPNEYYYADAVTRKKIALLNDTTVPQVELVFVDGYTGHKGYPPQGDPLYGKRFLTLQVAVQYSLSRGNIHVNATDPLGSQPVIDARYFTHPYDRAAQVAAARVLRAIAAAEPLRSVWVDEYEPGFALVPPGGATDEEWWAGHVARAVKSIWHTTSTCSMLPLGEGGVVGPDLRVYGTGNLRVVDASVVPMQVSAHPQTVVYGIAEVAAGMILSLIMNHLEQK
ncbi:hypothetical protein VMCG_01258 [Cytospora schulzeri]|uniref:Glucose-methanol-choline oxidoreductase N-terminal domain-containing protein n=1 Tax=Cytospora schulzeri TaxID=448051 RepID=A0A423X5H9_9PEZI|nr:hypothetical protein VMCG_01258 [Valsa malicola]